MSKQNLRRNCTVLLSALFSSTFTTNAHDNSIVDHSANNKKIEDVIVDVGINNNTEEVTKDDSSTLNKLIKDSNKNIYSESVKEKKDENINIGLDVNSNLGQSKKSSGLSTPAKLAIGLGIPVVLVASLEAKLWWDNHNYNLALEEANKYADEARSKNRTVNNEPLDSWVYHIQNSKLSKKLKTKLLILFKNDGCSELANWLCSKLEYIKEDMELEFLTDDGFIKYCQNFKYNDDNIKNKRNFLILKFIESYLNYNKKSLLANPPKSFDQIPNWNMIKTVIGADFTPFENPEKVENNAIRFKIQNKIGKIYTITIK